MSEEEKMNERASSGQNDLQAAGSSGPHGSISRKLRDFYDAVQEEAIPDRFLDLLEKLDQAERNAQAQAQ